MFVQDLYFIQFLLCLQGGLQSSPLIAWRNVRLCAPDSLSWSMENLSVSEVRNILNPSQYCMEGILQNKINLCFYTLTDSDTTKHFSYQNFDFSLNYFKQYFEEIEQIRLMTKLLKELMGYFQRQLLYLLRTFFNQKFKEIILLISFHKVFNIYIVVNK